MHVRPYWKWLVTLTAILVVVQVGWWVHLLFDDATTLTQLHSEFVRRKIPMPVEIKIPDPNHRRRMMLSEGLFFLAVTALGLYLIYRSLAVVEQSRKLQRRFLEDVSHQSKTPLTVLKLLLEAVRPKLSDGESVLAIDQGIAEVARLNAVLERALDLNRLDEGTVRMEWLPLGELIHSVRRRLDPLLASSQVSIEEELDEFIQVRGDVSGLQVLVQSLLENAIQYNTSTVKRLSIRLERRHRTALLTVGDNGPGISAKDAPFIFDRFFRGSSRSQGPGSGLGLYLTRRVARAHRGDVRLLRSSLGAVFEVSLPCSLRRAEA